MNLLLLIASFFSTVLFSTADVSCNFGDTEYSGYCYTFVDQRQRYPDAQAHCASLGGSLVRFRGDSDGRWLTTTAATKFHATYGNFWIGLHLDKDNEFVWDDGHQVDYVNWAPGYPFSGYDYVAAQLSNTKWVTVQSSSSLPFICFYQKGHNSLDRTTAVPTQKPLDVCNGADLNLGKRCYFFNPTLLPFDVAQQQCDNSGKTLAIFDDQSQINFVTGRSHLHLFFLIYNRFSHCRQQILNDIWIILDWSR
ncbi:unnamed protein product [Caenorhabditis brenneri]